MWFAESDLMGLDFKVSRVDGSMAWNVPFKEIFSKQEFASNLGGVKPVYWTPDSRYLYFVPQLCCWNPPVLDDFTSRLLRMDTQNGLVEEVFSGFNFISFSPNDQFIARVSEKNSPINVELIKLADGSTENIELIAPEAYRQGGKILWSPDGKRFLIVTAYGIKYGDTGPFDMQSLILVNAEIQEQRIIAQDVNGTIVPLDWSLDDTITYQTLYEGTLNKPVTWTENLGSGQVTRTEEVIQAMDQSKRIEQCAKFAVHRSPDGKWIICGYTSPFEVINVGTQYSLPVDLYTFYGKVIKGNVQPFKWSSDGKYLYFGMLPEAGGVEAAFHNTALLLRMELVTGKLTEILPPTFLPDGQMELFHVAVSPSGQKLAYSSRNNDMSVLHIFDTQTGATKNYNVHPLYTVIGKFFWSPDSTKMAFVAAETNAAGLVKQSVFLVDGKKNPVPVAENFPANLIIEGLSNDKRLRLYSPMDKSVQLLDLSTNQTQFLGVATPSK
jgi:WD40 repeat protein